jgi:hypothetical protein
MTSKSYIEEIHTETSTVDKKKTHILISTINPYTSLDIVLNHHPLQIATNT